MKENFVFHRIAKMSTPRVWSAPTWRRFGWTRSSGRILRDWRGLAALLLALALGGCVSLNRFATPGADWQTHVGQLQYLTAERSFMGEAVVRTRGRDEFQMDFVAGPGFPLLRVRQDDRARYADGALTRLRHGGDPSWFRLRPLFAELPAGAPSLIAEFPETRERFIFHFRR
jgi:hypothetical protein